MVSDFMAGLELDCRERADIRLLYPHELPQPSGRENSREPFRWKVDLPGKRRVGVVPDKVFALDITHSDRRIERTHYFLEADRGTMPIERRDLRQSCVLRKLKAYEATAKSQALQNRLGARRFRAVIVTPKKERAEHIAEAVSNLASGRRLFIFLSGQPHGLSSLLIPRVADHP
jgi:hypothetical protein